jgi:transcriptional regulator with XRE-family HTH domain
MSDYRKDKEVHTFRWRVGSRLRERRLALKLTLQDVAGRTAGMVSPAQVCQYELGHTEPRVSRFLALCYALGLDPHELLPRDVLKAVAGTSDQKLVKALH